MPIERIIIRSRLLHRSVLAGIALTGVAVIAPVLPGQAAKPAQLAQLKLGATFDKCMASMRARNYPEALAQFQSATQAKPADSRPWMMLGMVQNRLGSFPAALAALDKSAGLGMTAPRLDFDIGWAALNAGAPQRALDHLTAYEKAKPGEAKTSEFLGRAYFGLGKLDEAEKSLREALQRDPGLLPSVKLYLSRIAAARGESSTAVTQLFDILRAAPNSPISQSVRKNVLRPLANERLNRRRQAEKPWNALVSTSVGHNDNVTAYSSDLALPSESSNRVSGFLSVEGAAQYVHRITGREPLPTTDPSEARPINPRDREQARAINDEMNTIVRGFFSDSGGELSRDEVLRY